MKLPPITFARSARPARACLLLMLLWTTALSGDARAQPAPAPAPAVTEVAESDALILQGLQLREQGKDSEALALFVRAQQLAPTPRALAQRALAEQALGEWAQAEVHLREALAATDDPWILRHREALDGALAVIGEQLGQLQVNGGVVGAELRLDGQLVGTLPLSAPLRVVVGRPMLEVAATGYYPVRREITIKAGSLSTASIELVPLPQHPIVASAPGEPVPAGASAQPVPRDQPPPPKLTPIVFWSAAGVTAVVGGLTLWSGLNASAKNDAYEAYARAPGATSEEAERGYEDASSAQTRTNVLLVGTGVAAAATLAIGLFFTDWGSASSAEAPAAVAATRVRVAAASDGTEHRIHLYGRF